MVHNIYFSICGEGYGHSSRDMAIAAKLKSSGANVLMGSYGYALDRLKKSFDCIKIEKEFEMTAKDGAFDLKATISQSTNSVLHYSRIISREKKIMEDFSATCMVADGRGASVFAAFKLGLPCIIISNQTSIESFFKESKFLLNLIGLIFAKFKSDNIPKNTTVVGFCEDPSPYIAAAELVIAQAGHSTAMEILTLGKPALIIPIKDHVEQEYNAKRMKELGMCETLDYESFNGEILYEKIKLLLNENRFKEKAKLFSDNAREMKGSQRAADIILELSNRIQSY